MGYQLPQGNLYDLTTLRQMASGNEQFVMTMVNTFLNETPRSIKEITAALEKQDWETLRAAAHKIKPSMEIMGILELKEDIKIIESNAKHLQHLDDMPELIEKLNAICNVLFEQLKAIR